MKKWSEHQDFLCKDLRDKRNLEDEDEKRESLKMNEEKKSSVTDIKVPKKKISKPNLENQQKKQEYLDDKKKIHAQDFFRKLIIKVMSQV